LRPFLFARDSKPNRNHRFPSRYHILLLQVEKNDRKWFILAVFLLTVSVGLLTTVAYRLDKVSLIGHLVE
jgi:hypothetical protein